MSEPREFNLLESAPKTVRNLTERRRDKEENRRIAARFGREYFDGPRARGYGGYRYDGRWVAVAERAIAEWKLTSGDRVVDVGCAKGFFVKDLAAAMPGLLVFGLDISDYALDQAHPDAAGRLVKGSCDALPFGNNSLSAAFAINTIHNLDRDGCVTALREIERVAPGRGFVQVDAYRNDEELDVFIDWMLTARTYLKPDEWLELFREAGYTGRYYWTILEVDEDLIRD